MEKVRYEDEPIYGTVTGAAPLSRGKVVLTSDNPKLSEVRSDIDLCAGGQGH
jgi:hypothetical protein